jgi:hypothetical protein
MTQKQSYSLVVLKYCHDLSAGELLNIGVLIHAPMQNFVGLRMKSSAARIARTFPNLNVSAYKKSVRAIERGISGFNKNHLDLFATKLTAKHIFEQIIPSSDGSITAGELRFGLSADPERTLEKLFQKFVLQFEKQSKHRRDDAAVWRPIRNRLDELKIANFLESKTIRSQLDSVSFEHAWKNGAWHCYQPVSFDLTTEDYIRQKAAKWAGHLLALQGTDDDFLPYFFVGKPDNEALLDAYHDAIEILKLSPAKVQVFEEKDSDELVSQIEDLVRANDHPI